MFWPFKKRRKPNLKTVSIDQEEFARILREKKQRRSLRVFVSHRWDGDAGLHDFMTSDFNEFEIDDLSLDKSRRLEGVRGGTLDELEIKQEIAARIFGADVVIAPSTKAALKPKRTKVDGEYAVQNTDWISWEIEIAAVCFNIPVVFVDHKEGLQRRNRLYRRLKEVGAKVITAVASKDQIITAIASVFDESILDYYDEKSENEELKNNRAPAKFEEIMAKHKYKVFDLDRPVPAE